MAQRASQLSQFDYEQVLCSVLLATLYRSYVYGDVSGCSILGAHVYVYLHDYQVPSIDRRVDDNNYVQS
jgi:hypothetical protein